MAGKTSGSASRSKTAASPGARTHCVRYQRPCGSYRPSHFSAASSTAPDGGHRSSRPEGGESGPDARPLDLAWALELAAACDQTSTAFFMKQLGTAVGPRTWLARPERWRLRNVPVEAQTPRDCHSRSSSALRSSVSRYNAEPPVRRALLGSLFHLDVFSDGELSARIGTVTWNAIANRWPLLRQLPALHDLA